MARIDFFFIYFVYARTFFGLFCISVLFSNTMNLGFEVTNLFSFMNFSVPESNITDNWSMRRINPLYFE